MTTPAQPRHARAEIRDFAKWMKGLGWTYESTDNSGHTLWSHPKASGLYKLPETPRRFNVQRARGDVLRLMGQRPTGKHRGKPSVAAPRRDFALEQLSRERREAAQAEARARQEREREAQTPIPVVPVRRSPQQLPWEDQPEHYDRGLARLMREIPGGP